MIRRILVPIDAENWEPAIGYAERLAVRHDAAIVLLAVVDVDSIERVTIGAGTGAGYYARELRERHLDQAHTKLREALDEASEQLARGGVAVRQRFDTGPITKVVVEASLRSDFVVISRDTNFRFEVQEDPGNRIYKILRSQTRPTMVVPEDVRDIKTIVVAHDLSIACSRALYLMLQLRPFPDAKVVVVHADEQGVIDEEDWDDGIEYLADHGVEAEMIVRHLAPPEAVLDVVAERDADAVLLGPYTKGLWQRLLFGSTGRELLERAKIPLIFGI